MRSLPTTYDGSRRIEINSRKLKMGGAIYTYEDKEKGENVNMIGKKVASVVLASLLVLSVSMMFNNEALAQYEYPPLPLIAVKVPAVGQIDVWLMGEDGTELDSFWDIAGVDIVMHYNPDALSVNNIIVDPQEWFTSFWPGGIAILWLENSPGLVRVAFVGITDLGAHTAPFGQGRLFTLETTVVDMNNAEIELKNPDPRPNIAPWGIYYFPLDVAGFPHPERVVPPWSSLKKAPPIPHVVTVQGPPVAAFTESTHNPKPNEVIYLDASGSHSEVPIVSYEWDFNSDGVVDAFGVTTSTYYSQFGFYEITLKVTDSAGMTDTVAAIKMVNVLQNAEAEHRILKVLSDEDGNNTLTATARNFGTVSAQVKAKFTTIDKATGAELGTLESAPVTVMTGTRATLSALWDPYDYGWTSGTTVRYDVRVELSFFDGQAWITGETFKLGFRATD